MEEEKEQHLRQQHLQHQHSPPHPSTTSTALDKKDVSGGEAVLVVPCPAGDREQQAGMGRNRSGSTSSSVSWMGEGGGSSIILKTPTTPRQPSKRDSGYHTDYSPATFAPHSHFTFESPEEQPHLPALEQTSQVLSPQSLSSLASPVSASAFARPPSSLSSSSSMSRPQRLLTDLHGQDVGDDDAFAASDNTSQYPRSPATLTLAAEGQDQTLTSRGQPCVVEEVGELDEKPASSRLRGEEEELKRDEWRKNKEMKQDSEEEDNCEEEEEEDKEEDEMANTDYHHGPLSFVSIPGGGRIRPLLARTIATQTPHLHCQLMDQILASPQPLLHCVRGSAVRRLRYYSEGEESVPGVGVSSLPHGPLPDIVPVSRERSLSAPDLEALQRQRARAVGRELRRISDEWIRSHEAFRGNPNGALAALHAELNGAAAFFLTGVRRFLCQGLAAYFRHLFHWTRRALASTEQLHQDSSVDEQR